MKLCVIELGDKSLYMGRKSSILNHSYQFSIRKYDIFIMNEYHNMIEKKITWLFACVAHARFFMNYYSAPKRANRGSGIFKQSIEKFPRQFGWVKS